MSSDGFAGLDADYTRLIDDWVGDLRETWPAIEQWWADLQKKLNASGRNIANLHWPAGPASHPRIIALYRRHFFRVHALNIARYAEEEPDVDVEAQWGSDADEETERSGPIPPNTLLIEMMSEYAADLFKHFKYFVYVPIGEDQSLELC